MHEHVVTVCLLFSWTVVFYPRSIIVRLELRVNVAPTPPDIIPPYLPFPFYLKLSTIKFFQLDSELEFRAHLISRDRLNLPRRQVPFISPYTTSPFPVSGLKLKHGTLPFMNISTREMLWQDKKRIYGWSRAQQACL